MLSGDSFPLGGGASVSLAEAHKTNEEDVPDAHEGKPPPSPSGRPRSVHWWVPAAGARLGIALSSPVAHKSGGFAIYVLS